MTDRAATTRRILFLDVTDGVTGFNLTTYYFACMVAIMLASFLPISQAFLLADVLNIPESQQGVISGDLNFWGEIVIITTIGLYGVLSDKIGRRLVMVFGFAVMGVGIYLYPRATDVSDLLMYRVVYSFGISAVTCMIVTVVADYVHDSSRGKASGLLGFMNGIGAMIAALVLIKLPARFVANGMSPLDAATTTYGIVVAIAFVTAISQFVGLRKHEPVHEERRTSALEMFVEGIRAARDPGVSLAYAASFVARGNFAIMGTFFALWLTTYGTAELGITGREALNRGGGIIAISYAAALFGAPLFGVLTDRVRRTSALAIALGVSFVGYGGTYFVDNPFVGVVLPLLIFIGLAEVGCVITSGVLIAQQAPEKIRGSVIGIFNLVGAVGILVASKLGGYMFDHWRAAGPFVLFGVLALIVMLWALIVSRRVTPVDPTAGADHALDDQAQEASSYS